MNANGPWNLAEWPNTQPRWNYAGAKPHEGCIAFIWPLRFKRLRRLLILDTLRDKIR